MTQNTTDFSKKNAEKAQKNTMKKRLLEWGGTLEVCRRKHEEIRKINRMIDDVRGLRQNVKAEDGMTRLEEISFRYSEEIREITESIQSVMEEKRKMENLIDQLPQEEQQFIHLRYEKGYGYDYISLKMHISRAQCFRVNDRALEILIALEEEMTKKMLS